jgi:bacillithiol system protein YtxJ
MRVLESLADLDEAVHRSHAHPIVIFKHSATCGVSAFAREEVEDFTALEREVEVFVVSVQFGSIVSNEIAKRFGLRHESPQVLVVHHGVLVWHASHFRVTREEIASALATSASSQRDAAAQSRRR